MTTIKELKQWLNNFPEDTIVEFAVQQPASMYQSYGDVKFLQPNLQRSDADEGWEFLDFIDNQYVKKDAPHFGKCFLRFGESFAHRIDACRCLGKVSEIFPFKNHNRKYKLIYKLSLIPK